MAVPYSVPNLSQYVKNDSDVDLNSITFPDGSTQNQAATPSSKVTGLGYEGTTLTLTQSSGISDLTTTIPSGALPFAFTRTGVVDDISVSFQTNTPLTDLALNITPTSTSQKVILHLTVLGDSNNDSWEFTIRIKRTIGGVDTYLTPTPVGSRNPMNSTFSVAVGIDDYSGTIKQANMVLVDTNPNTTSQITYTPVIFAYSNNVFYQNRTKNDTDDIQHERAFSTFTAECKA